jgi:hypothetical protein
MGHICGEPGVITNFKSIIIIIIIYLFLYNRKVGRPRRETRKEATVQYC